MLSVTTGDSHGDWSRPFVLVQDNSNRHKVRKGEKVQESIGVRKGEKEKVQESIG